MPDSMFATTLHWQRAQCWHNASIGLSIWFKAQLWDWNCSVHLGRWPVPGLHKESTFLLVLLDSAALNTINSGILLGCLAGLGQGGIVCCSPCSFSLTGLKRYYWETLVQLPDIWHIVWHKVPYFPVLINIYMKPLEEVIQGFGVGTSTTLNDHPHHSQLYLSLSSNTCWGSNWNPRVLPGSSKDLKPRFNLDKKEVSLLQKFMMHVLEYWPILNGAALPLQKDHSLEVILDSLVLLDAQVVAEAGRGDLSSLG